MKIRFDTNTKDPEEAAKAFDTIACDCHPFSLDLSMNTWGDKHYNLCGEIDSAFMSQLEDILKKGTFNEDTEKL